MVNVASRCVHLEGRRRRVLRVFEVVRSVLSQFTLRNYIPVPSYIEFIFLVFH